MSFSTPEASLREMVDLAREFGYHGIEPRIGAGHKHGIDIPMSRSQRREAKATVSGAGLTFSCIATSLKFADPSAERQTFEDALRVIDLAADLGCGVIRVFGGAYPQEISREDAVSRCVEAFRRVEPHASERKIVLALETHDAWTDPADVMAVVNDVGSKAVAVNWDVMHPVRASGYDMESAFNVLAPAIRHVHVHDGAGPGEDLKIYPMGTGHYDHRTAIALLKKSGYTGFISGEWILSLMPDDYGFAAHLPRELETLKSYESDAS